MLGLTPTCIVNYFINYPISSEQSTVTEVTPGSTLTPTVGNHPMSTTALSADPSQSSDNDTPIVGNASIPISTSATPSSTILKSPLFKFLVQYVAQSPEKRPALSTKVTGARVLTISEGYEIYWEKEGRKKKGLKRRKR